MSDFNVHKRIARSYELSNGEKVIIPFEDRHSLGHAIISVFAENSIDISKELRGDGTVSKELNDLLESIAKSIGKFKKVDTGEKKKQAMAILALHLGAFEPNEIPEKISQ
jgi:hypothetical protein